MKATLVFILEDESKHLPLKLANTHKQTTKKHTQNEQKAKEMQLLRIPIFYSFTFYGKKGVDYKPRETSAYLYSGQEKIFL